MALVLVFLHDLLEGDFVFSNLHFYSVPMGEIMPVFRAACIFGEIHGEGSVLEIRRDCLFIKKKEQIMKYVP